MTLSSSAPRAVRTTREARSLFHTTLGRNDGMARRTMERLARAFAVLVAASACSSAPPADKHPEPGARFVAVTRQLPVLDNARSFARRRGDASDRVNLVTNLYASHPSVASLYRPRLAAAIVVPGGAALDAVPETRATIAFVVRS